MNSKSYHHENLSPAHQAMIQWVEPNSDVLEVGCATGYVSRVLSRDFQCHVTGVEFDPEQAEKATEHLDRIVVGDIELDSVWRQCEGTYRHVLFGDVLEHLKDPWQLLQRTREFISPDGSVLASIPNVAYYKVRKELLLGRFDYASYGILDNCHLRFFTEKTVRMMFDAAGYDVRRIIRMYRGRADRILGNVAPNAFTYQFVIQATPRR